jgi:hypothetical protein
LAEKSSLSAKFEISLRSLISPLSSTITIELSTGSNGQQAPSILLPPLAVKLHWEAHLWLNISWGNVLSSIYTVLSISLLKHKKLTCHHLAPISSGCTPSWAAKQTDIHDVGPTVHGNGMPLEEFLAAVPVHPLSASR